jgi:hypothetical protein
MFYPGSEHPWFYAYGCNLFVDFCIWVLEVDGLQGMEPYGPQDLMPRDGVLG